MKSRNGGLIRPSSTSATAHQATASAEANAHQAPNRHHSRFGRWQAHQITAGRHAARLATALTAPSGPARPGPGGQNTQRPGTVCPQRTDHRQQHHGASIIGSVSDEIEPSVVRDPGDSANAAAPTNRDDRVPIPSVSATRSRPQKPAVSSSAHHNR